MLLLEATSHVGERGKRIHRRYRARFNLHHPAFEFRLKLWVDAPLLDFRLQFRFHTIPQLICKRFSFTNRKLEGFAEQLRGTLDSVSFRNVADFIRESNDE